MAAGPAVLQNGGIVLIRAHGLRQLVNVGRGLLVLALKNAGEPVKIGLVGVFFVSDNVAAVLPYDEGITQGIV